MDNLNNEYSEDQRPHFTLIRFFIDRAAGTGLEGWGPQPPAPGSDTRGPNKIRNLAETPRRGSGDPTDALRAPVGPLDLV
ncbi:hypothetical protein [Streptomyces sp. 7N604]|uniref:hypothetical protein n=1 Tax=Streptomyces sp. 7N604 TaxID=3457415 RepID=UPI003FD5579F